ncbi:uncharacterized protein J8A68_000854 [[Candida] subhashii]|uniref:Glutaredoxin domain-containing protein n=1 Tax=[Candida] subhashii TaxID=561895 RepID=A0A8J5QSK2_9ASCO|nr:uncharacterized protein J8A68_000854 [[Candida] subhashii]KAG7665648.1 hypothetical protein J8A68_000854 [[Candida] subhashii]
MDFEQRLEEVEQKDSPHLVGSSLRSADDSIHNNYIHPEKYQSSKQKPSKKRPTTERTSSQLLNPSIAASLDDLINEGALLGSEEDFDRFLEQDGTIKSEVKLLTKQDAESTKPSIQQKEVDDSKKENQEVIEKPKQQEDIESERPSGPSPAQSFGVGNVGAASVGVSDATADAAFYSNPNLSEYQLEHQIKDHSELLQNVQSHDLDKLPRSFDALASQRGTPGSSFSKSNTASGIATPISKPPIKPLAEGLVHMDKTMHAPYLHTERAGSRSRSANPSSKNAGERSSSRTSPSTRQLKPHLARGDSYKNTNREEPSNYELPPDFAGTDSPANATAATSTSQLSSTTEEESVHEYGVQEAVVEEDEEEDDRRSRRSRPTMRESVARAEALQAEAAAAAAGTTGIYSPRRTPIASAPKFGVGDYDEHPLTRDPSLVTTGDYVNFEVDNPRNNLPATGNLYAARSASATNYLRTISRSRSRARERSQTRDGNVTVSGPTGGITGSELDGKNDANVDNLVSGGALISDDPYVSIDKLDSMVEEVLSGMGNKNEGSDVHEIENIQEEDEPKDEQEDEDGSKKEKIQDSVVSEEVEVPEEESKKVELTESESKEAEPEQKKGAEIKDESVVEEEDVENEDTKQAGEPSNEDDEIETTGYATALEEPLDSAKSVDDTKEDNEEEVKGAKEEEEKQEVAKEDTVQKDVEGEVKAEPEVEEKSEEANVEPKIEEASEKPKAAEEDKEKSVKEEVPLEEEPNKTDAAPDADDSIDDLEISPEEIRKHLESQPIYLFTSLAGGMQITNRTNRLVTILTGNGIKFTYRDLGTDEEAKKIWRRYGQGKTLPGVVRGDDVIGNWHDIDEANEEYRLNELLYETL